MNLTLHVTGKRVDGYHLLDSLVVFAGVGDQLTAQPADTLSLSVDGMFSTGVPTDDRNLVIRAAKALAKARGVKAGARIKLTKTLPHAAGIGGGSADAAAAIRLLSKMWDVPPLSPYDPEVLQLGADVPVCLCAPHPVRMQGIGDKLWRVPALPEAGLVLVNPRVEVPTGTVFGALRSPDNPVMDAVPEDLDLDGFATWLATQRNDLEQAASAVAPEIGTALTRLRAQPGVLAATMSGSGATCIGLTRDLGAARQAARVIQIAEMGWWVAPAQLMAPAPTD